MIKILCVGKIKDNNLAILINDYLKKINKYYKTEVMELKDDINYYKVINKLENKINLNDYNIALDLRGEELSSVDFAEMIEKTFNINSNITFIIGPSDGLNDSIRKKCNKIISFSKLTFPHALFRLILMEQLYRAFKINNNEAYHK